MEDIVLFRCSTVRAIKRGVIKTAKFGLMVLAVLYPISFVTLMYLAIFFDHKPLPFPTWIGITMIAVLCLGTPILMGAFHEGYLKLPETPKIVLCKEDL
jgi:hypothetical protein